MGPFIWSRLHNSIKLADSLNAFNNKSGRSTCQTLYCNINVKIAIYVEISFRRFLYCIYIGFLFLLVHTLDCKPIFLFMSNVDRCPQLVFNCKK